MDMLTHFVSNKLTKLKSIAGEIAMNPSILDDLDKGDVRQLLLSLMKEGLIKANCQAVIDYKVLQVRQSVMDVMRQGSCPSFCVDYCYSQC
jgi:hypothetical protein